MTIKDKITDGKLLEKDVKILASDLIKKWHDLGMDNPLPYIKEIFGEELVNDS